MAAPASADPRADAFRIAEHCELSDEARTRVHHGMTPDSYLAALTDAGLQRDALTFLAHWLEKRKAIWWGCQCLWHAFRPEPDPNVEAALQKVVRWVFEPGENARRQCEVVAEEFTAGHAVGALALAVFCSGGSLSSPGLPVAAPAENLTAVTLAAALELAAAALPDPARARKQFALLGRDIARGQNLWTPS